MGILSDLFGINQTTVLMPPAMISDMPQAAINAIEKGTLPQLATQTLLLRTGEHCHFVDKACLITEQTKTRYQGTYGGFNVRIVKGLTYRTGKSNSTPIHESVPVYTPGYLYITDRRIVFAAKKNGFEQTVRNVSAIMPYSDAIGIQIGSKTYNLLLPKPYLAIATLQMIL